MLFPHEREQLVRLLHKASESAGDHEFVLNIIFDTASSAGKATLATSAVENHLTTAEQITALDALPQGLRDDAVERWTP